jgi:hypothetical protein
MVSRGGTKRELSEWALKMLEQPSPSNLGVRGSNPFRRASSPLYSTTLSERHFAGSGPFTTVYN